MLCTLLKQPWAWLPYLQEADGYSQVVTLQLCVEHCLMLSRIGLPGFGNGYASELWLQRWEGSWQAEGLHQQKWGAPTHLRWLQYQLPWQWLPSVLAHLYLGQINWQSLSFIKTRQAHSRGSSFSSRAKALQMSPVPFPTQSLRCFCLMSCWQHCRWYSITPS